MILNAAPLTLREVSRENVQQVVELSVRADQEQYVSANGNSLAEAHYEPDAWFRALYADQEPVGLCVMFIDPERDDYYIWRYMIDQRYQGKGYGQAGLKLIIDYICATYPQAQAITLSHVPGNEVGAAVYRKLGFIYTGEIDQGELVMRLDLK